MGTKEKSVVKIVRKSTSRRKNVLKVAPEKPCVGVKRIGAFYKGSSSDNAVFYKDIRSALVKIIRAEQA